MLVELTVDVDVELGAEVKVELGADVVVELGIVAVLVPGVVEETVVVVIDIVEVLGAADVVVAVVKVVSQLEFPRRLFQRREFPNIQRWFCWFSLH